jgi:hypothetical protein
MASNDFSPEELQKDLAFSNADLTSAMMQQAALYAHYATLAAKFQKIADTKELVVEITESKVDKALRDAAAQAGEKITEAALSKAVKLNKEYIQAVNLCRHALEAFKQRRDMLVQIGVAQREEMKGELFIKGREAVAAQAQKEEVLRRMESNVG